ncbi:MAG: ribosome small subunit-dependent GTPase A [Candidatus Izimaplasma sp.]|nr:ribosome small subunit-dependent GTPase A [Candidatus Izimaplasma bacterium]
MKTGLITKLIGGLYTVKDNKDYYELKARGKFRHTNESPKVGDRVNYTSDFIMEINPRKNELSRPPISNVDQALLINSIIEPNFSFNLLDRFLVLIENQAISPVIIITKIDLVVPEKLTALKQKLAYYETFYPVIFVSSKTNKGIDKVKAHLKDKISVFAGQTGTGKSSLLNAINHHLDLKTDKISHALGRGKHTTRHTELLEIAGGLVADTPGFSKLSFYDIPIAQIKYDFIDFFALSKDCKFNSCMHLNEPKCKVKEEVEKGNILQSRYHNYKLIIEEITSQEKNKY